MCHAPPRSPPRIWVRGRPCAGMTMALPGHIRSMEIGGVLRQGIRLAACVYVPRAEAPGLPSLQTPDFSPGEFGCLAHRPIFIAMTICGFRDNEKALCMIAAATSAAPRPGAPGGRPTWPGSAGSSCGSSPPVRLRPASPTRDAHGASPAGWGRLRSCTPRP